MKNKAKNEIKNKVWDQDGKVSIWFNVSFEPKNQLIGWYDEDDTEATTLDPNNIIESLSGNSYSESFKEQANETAHKLGINPEWNACFLIYNVNTFMPSGYQLSEKDKLVKGVNADEAAIFLGVFDFKK